LYTYEDEFHLDITNEQELLEKLADHASNPDYDYIAKLFQQYRKTVLGSSNSTLMFKCLAAVVEDYNNSNLGKVIL